MAAPIPSNADLTAPRFESLMEVLRLRRSVRSFEPPPEPLPAEVLRGICEAGRWAPSGANTQPWHFVVAAERADVLAVSDVFVRQADRLVVVVIGDGRVEHPVADPLPVDVQLVVAQPRYVAPGPGRAVA